MIWAIAILEDDPSDIAPMHYVGNGKLGMAVRYDLNLEELEKEEFLLAAVVEHDRLICQLFAKVPTLPLRFGTVFKSQAALQDYLHSHQEALTAKLAKLAGYAEYLLTLTISEPAPDPISNLQGKDYLLAKKAQYKTMQTRRSQREQQCQALISQIPTEQQQIVAPQASEFLRMYFLATAPEYKAFQDYLEIWRSQNSQWQVELSFPLPPYHFC